MGADVQSWLSYSTTDEYFKLLHKEHARKIGYVYDDAGVMHIDMRRSIK